MAGDYRLITEAWLAANFTPNSGYIAGSNNTLVMDCTQVRTRYNVTISGGTPTSTRCPSQNELTAISNIPTITTNSLYIVPSSTYVQSGGNVTSIGGASVTDRGLCWSTSVNPTIANNKVSSGTGTGSFIANMTSVFSLTTYHYRAFATNSYGTAYGEDRTFTFVKIGDSYLGGIVAYLSLSGDRGYDQYNQHGIIMVTSNYGTLAGWGSNSYVGGNALYTQYGFADVTTPAIVTHYGSFATAAKICQDAGWLLPTIDDMFHMWAGMSMYGGFPDGIYWSSSEYDTGNAWKINMSTSNTYSGSWYPGTTSYLPKGGTGLIRMIKYF